jgi:hypothetical protein
MYHHGDISSIGGISEKYNPVHFVVLTVKVLGTRFISGLMGLLIRRQANTPSPQELLNSSSSS